MFKEFKEFAMRGNIVDLAVGVIIGGAFQKIVNSLVNDLIIPVMSIFIGKIDYSSLEFTISNVSIKYGSFITNVINFIIIAFALFLFVRYINKLNKNLENVKIKNMRGLDKINEKINKKFHKKKKKEEPAEPKPEPTTKVCPYCFSEINIKATRCPNCTSVLEEIKEHNEDKKELENA